ncbi:MAG: hypothetical protein Q8Q94_00730 [bacterium]|nr:hypothetical protein [bacterium]
MNHEVIGRRRSTTLEMIKEDLKHNPPSQGIMNIHIDFTYNAPFYLTFLLDRLDHAERLAWRRVARQKK